MPLSARTTLLALAALAAVAFAAVRITRAAEQKPIEVEQARREREVTPAQAAATLAKLRTPPGFRQVSSCRFPEPGSAQKCFWAPRAQLINAPAMSRMASFWRVRAGAQPLLDGCSRLHHESDGVVLGHCSWELELGPELVSVASDYLTVPSGRPRTGKIAEALRYWRQGTEIRLTVIGHWPHDKAPSGRD